MVETCEHVWSKCMDFFRDNLQPATYKTWFEPIKPLKMSNNVLTIQVPSPFFYEFLEDKYIDLLKKALYKELGPGAKLEYQVVVDKNDADRTKGKESGTVRLPGQNGGDAHSGMPRHNGSPVIKNPFIIPGIKTIDLDPQLNPNNSFNNFIEGDCNKVACSAGNAIASKPGKTPFNPLFVYGESGLGKTHLAQAIGLKVKELNPNKTVLYLSANQFQTQYTESVRNNTQNDFVNFYKLIDFLIIDDIHELSGKEGTQNTFFHIFNHLHQSGKQLILTSDKPPFQLQGVEQRLLSRFKWGLSTELESPDYLTRKAILKHKVYQEGLEIGDDVIDYLAENITANIRELEGALISLIAQSTFITHKEVDIEMAQDIVSKLIKTSNRTISIEKIQRVVCDYFELSLDVLHSKSRKREIVQARQIAMYLAKNYTKNSLQNIGQQIGKRDHATVLHACKTVNNLMDTDKSFKSSLKELELKLKF
ncbi:chromosomal replication initiator protein DnaA [Saccharicrinis sp. FJH2]|uniref:chromosomal replication initiator protein DnaA n=1 Tax=unclassified Saccharicrinis TaxID=2646859 RepID=UPI0035D42B90